MKKLLLFFFFIPLLGISQDAQLIYKKNFKSCVSIISETGQGSGFFIDSNHIITNFHVIDLSHSATIYLTNSDFGINVIGATGVDSINDLVILKIENNIGKPVKFSRMKSSIGQKIFCISTPKGLESTLSDGLISSFRKFHGRDLIQITAPVSHGSSGSPVLDMNGELTGIVVGSIEEGQNLNFAIPLDKLMSLIKNQVQIPIPLTNLISEEKLFSSKINTYEKCKANELLRDGLNFNSNSSFLVKYSKTVYIIREEGDWYYVFVDDHYGYLRKICFK